MKTHLKSFFIPVYEKYFSTLKFRNIPDKQDKLVDAVYHQQEFINWLQKRNSKVFNDDAFKKLCTHPNFNKYIVFYKSIKDKTGMRESKEIILERIQAENLKPVTKYEYDVDIVEVYYNFSNLLETVKFEEGLIKKEMYFNPILNLIEYYCKHHNLPFKKVLQNKYPILINYKDNNFDMILGILLITFDVNKIEAFLSYQNQIWKGKDLFASFVEHGVYRHVKNFSPIDNNKRLEKIMSWVEKNRHFVLPESKGGKRNKKPTFKNGKTKSDATGLFYWEFPEEKLTDLYNALVLNNKIEKNDFFIKLFKKLEDVPTNLTVWRAKPKQLIYLLYLLYNKKNQHNSIPIHIIATKLFTGTKGEFNSKTLNIIFLQMKKLQKDSERLSPGLQSIEKIVDDLNLS